MDSLDAFFLLGIALGFVGILLPFMPGSILIAFSVLFWAVLVDEPAAWGAFAGSLAFLVAGSVVKYLLPGKRLKDSGVPTSTLLLGGALGLVGFFVLPVIGLPIGFVLGIYLSERGRVPQESAWPATKAALKAVGLSILIELVFAVLATGAWLVGVFAT
ncbi:uncharacterized protein YqgC (DUF456 family) [Marmoricola sp. OAE513]|uniref:DUF456 domain-containing protein n=1 Tax=Marmoricola sp. OAE513 TaxID=2817894 RepID=UPI001D1FB2D3